MTMQEALPYAQLGATGPGGVKRGKSTLIQLAKKARPFFNRLMEPSSLVGNEPITDASVFPWYKELEAAFPAIQAEADRIMRFRTTIPPFRDFAPGHEKIAPNEDDWRSFFFWGYGYPIEGNIARLKARQ